MAVGLKGHGGLINEDFKEDVDGFGDRGFEDETMGRRRGFDSL